MNYRVIFPALVLALLAAACDQGGTGPAGARADTRFLISQAGGGASASMVALADGGSPEDGHGNSLSPSDVRSINIHVTGIAALPLGNDSVEDRDWVRLTATPRWLNLLTLPTQPDSGLQVARGNLPAGTYGHLRLLFDTANIVFAKTVTLGHGDHVRTFHADSIYKLYAGGFGMPEDSASEQEDDDADHFGIVVPATTFTVANDSSSTITIVFNPAQSLQRVLVTGKGLRIRPVMGAARNPEPEDSASEHDHGSGGHD